MADIVAKVFLGCRAKIFRAADAFYARRREGPYRFIQNRSRVAVVALKSDAAAEKPKDQLSRDFLGCSIFDFCNNIGTFRTWRDVRLESGMRTKAEVGTAWFRSVQSVQEAARYRGEPEIQTHEADGEAEDDVG